MQQNQSIYLSVIIPCYRGAELLQENIPLLKQYLQQQHYSWEIIIVDDGTEDDSIRNFAANNQLIYLRNEINQGKGAAVKKGMLAANGQYRIFTDADIPYELNAIETILNYLDKKEMSMVAGDRTLTGSAYYGMISQNRELGSKVFRFIAGRLVAGGMHDTQCGIKGFTAKVANELFGLSKIKGFAFDVEIYYLALKKNLDIKKIPVQLRNNQGKSVRMLRHGFRMIVDLFLIVANFYRGLYH